MKHQIAGRLTVAAIAAAFSVAAHAGCELATGPCSTDSRGNTYRTEQNLGGGYNTYRNGQLESQTSQNLSGGWTERRRDGSTRNYNYNPYESRRGTSPYSDDGE